MLWSLRISWARAITTTSARARVTWEARRRQVTRTAFDGHRAVTSPPLGQLEAHMVEPSGLLQRGETAIRYWLTGPAEAPLVVLTHGATADHTMFEDLVPALAQRYRVLTWDVPGHGASQPLPSGFGMDRLVQDQLALLDLLGAPKAVLVGQSMGGNLAQEVVFRHPERVAALVLIDCTDNFQKLTALEQASLASAGPIFALYPFKMLKRQSADASADTKQARERIAAMMDRVADKRSYIEILKRTTDVLHYEPDFRIHCPLLMLLGEHDRLGNIAKAMPAMAQRAGVSLVVVRGAGHASNMDQPEEVNAAILRFLDRLESAGPIHEQRAISNDLGVARHA
jgi:3-oxoadipate enol-lactonase